MSKPADMQLDLPPFPDFASAARATLEVLHDRLGFGLWAATRSDQSQQHILTAVDHRFGLAEGDHRPWLDLASERMLSGLAPRAAPNCRDELGYADVPLSQDFPVRAYIGVPLQAADGTLVGTLCAVDPLPQTSALYADLPLVELLARLLSTLLSAGLPVAEPGALPDL